MNIWTHAVMIVARRAQRRMSASELGGPIITGYIWLVGTPGFSFLTIPTLQGSNIFGETKSYAETTARYIFGYAFGTTWFASITVDPALGTLVAAF